MLARRVKEGLSIERLNMAIVAMIDIDSQICWRKSERAQFGQEFGKESSVESKGPFSFSIL